MNNQPIYQPHGQSFLPDMAEYAVVTEAQTALDHAGEDDRKLAAWARKYGQAAVDRCEELLESEDEYE